MVHPGLAVCHRAENPAHSHLKPIYIHQLTFALDDRGAYIKNMQADPKHSR